jgi:hypothetical protein
MNGLLPGSRPVFDDGTVSTRESSKAIFLAAVFPRSAENGCMRMSSRAIALPCLLAAIACGGKPAELVDPIAMPAFVDPSAPLPRIRFADGLVSANDVCPVTKRKLSILFPPVYVNGAPIGFC